MSRLTGDGWGAQNRAATAVRNSLDLDLTNLDRVLVHTDRAKLSCDPDLNVDTDGPVTVVLAGCDKTLEFD